MMDKKTLLAIVLCLVFYIGYTQYLSTKYPNMGMENTVTETVPNSDSSELSTTKPGSKVSKIDEIAVKSVDQEPTSANDLQEEKIKYLDSGELTLENEFLKIDFDQKKSAITQITLKKYYESALDESKKPKVLLESPIMVQGTLDIAQTNGFQNYQGNRDGNTLIFSKVLDDVLISQLFTLNSDYTVDLEVKYKNLREVSRNLTSGLLIRQGFLKAEESSGFGAGSFIQRQKKFIYGIGDSVETKIISEYCEDNEGKSAFSLKNSNLNFIGADYHYFGAFWLPNNQSTNAEYQRIKSTSGVCNMALTLYDNQGAVGGLSEVSTKFTSYFGPKDFDTLKNLNRQVESSVDFGWFGFVGKPLLLALKFLYSLTHNYGIAIIILTVILKILFYPLTKSSAVSMKKMQKLQPQLNAIREKNKSDPRKQQSEMMSFMSKHKINPAKGCLPIIPQIPVFIAYYNVLSQSFELRHAPFFGWIQDLSIMDPYYITPLLLGVGMFIQQKLTPNPSMDKTQAKIMMMMPLFFTFMMLSLPAGMVLYMLTNTIVSISQQHWLNKKLVNL